MLTKYHLMHIFNSLLIFCLSKQIFKIGIISCFQIFLQTIIKRFKNIFQKTITTTKPLTRSIKQKIKINDFHLYKKNTNQHTFLIQSFLKNIEKKKCSLKRYGLSHTQKIPTKIIKKYIRTQEFTNKIKVLLAIFFIFMPKH